jgi:hypothetical protein
MSAWERSPFGRAPWPLAASLALFFPTLLWTLPQTLAGLAFALYARARGHRAALYRFGPFLFVVVPWAPPWVKGISLGVVVLADEPRILTHEFCHLFTALWLAWLYLPVYGLEYLIVGHDRSPHERLTVRLEKTTRFGWMRVR